MSSIVVYNPPLLPGPNTDPDEGSKRRAGMLHVGGLLREALDDVTNDDGVRDAVNNVLEAVMPEPTENAAMDEASTEDPANPDAEEVEPATTYETRLESMSGGTFRTYRLRNRNNEDGDKKKPRFVLEELDGTLTNKKVKIDGKIDDVQGNMYRMTAVSPEKPAAANTWFYLSQKVYEDLKQIDAETSGDAIAIQDYLIATFAFTRCR